MCQGETEMWLGLLINSLYYQQVMLLYHLEAADVVDSFHLL